MAVTKLAAAWCPSCARLVSPFAVRDMRAAATVAVQLGCAYRVPSASVAATRARADAVLVWRWPVGHAPVELRPPMAGTVAVVADMTGAVLVDRPDRHLISPCNAHSVSDRSTRTSGARRVVPVADLADNGAGGMHAAALGAALEVAGYLAVLPTLSAAEHAVTHMIATQLLAAADLGERVEVRAQLERRTRNLAFLSATAAVDERPIARAQLTKSIVAAR